MPKQYRQPHTACHRGKVVRVKLKDGTVFIDRFHDRTKSVVFFKSGRKVPKGDIVSFSFFKANLPQSDNTFVDISRNGLEL